MGKQLRNASIDEFAAELGEVWPRDRRRPILIQWLGVVDHASQLMEEIRRGSWDRVANELAEVFVWWLALVHRLEASPMSNPHCVMSATDRVLYLGVSPSDVVWSKFPGVCPVCFGFAIADAQGWNTRIGEDAEWQKRGEDLTSGDRKLAYEAVARIQRCRCLARKAECENRAKGFKSFTKHQIERALTETICQKKPGTLRELDEALVKIYQPAIEVLSPEEIAFHLLEEVGEVSQAMFRLHLQPISATFPDERQMRLRALREELADVFSWTVTLRAKTHLVLQCATNYVLSFGEDQRTAALGDLFTTCLSPVSNLAELVLTENGAGNGESLRCDTCNSRPCNPTLHPSDNGELFGENALQIVEKLEGLR